MITHAHLNALEMRTQKRLGEMHETLNKILQQMPEMLGPSRKPTPTSAHGASVDSVIEEAKEDAAARMRKHGTLTVNIMKANNLIKADLLGLSDPYVHVGLPGLPGQPTKLTRTIRSNLNPEWDERIEFEGVLEQFVSSTCRLDLFDQDFRMSDAMRHGSSKQNILSDDKLGWLEFSLSELGTKDSILKNDCELSGVPHGTITFEVSWSPDSNAGVNTIRSLVEKDRDVKFQLRNLRRAMNAQAEKDRRKAARGMRRMTTLNRSPTQSIHGSPPGGGLQKQTTKISVSTSITDESDIRWSSKVCTSLCGPMIDPNSRFRTSWNICLAFFIIYCGIAVPFEIAFEVDMVNAMCGVGEERLLREDCPSYLQWFWLNFLVDLWFISDIVINFRTGYMQEGRLVKDDWLVAKAYLTSSSFFMDVLGSFPLNIVLMIVTPDNPYGNIDVAATDDAAGSAARANRLLRLLRLTKLAKLARMAKLRKYLASFEEFINPGVLAVTSLSAAALLCCHWFGCLWWLVSDLEIAEPDLMHHWYAGVENTWHPPVWLKNEENLGAKYAFSFFWGAGMVTSTIPFDILPLTPFESIATTFMMFVGLLLNAYVISSLTAALASMNSQKELSRKELGTVKTFLVMKGVPTDLRSRILEYFEYRLTSSQGLAESINMEEMPANLHLQLLIAMCKTLAAKCPLFRDLSEPCVVTLMSRLKPCVFVPGQVIVFEGHALENVYFINRGLVELRVNTLIVGTRRDSDNFGVDDFLTAYLSKEVPLVMATARGMSYCDVYSLSHEVLLDAVENDKHYQVRSAARANGLPGMEARDLRAATRRGIDTLRAKTATLYSKGFGGPSRGSTKGSLATGRSSEGVSSDRELMA